MRKLIIILLFLLLPQIVVAGCPVNELIYNTLTSIVFSFEKRNGTGEDTTNTANKRISLSYWNGSAWRWVGADNLWDDVTETQLAMTQLTGSQYYFNIPAAALSATVSGKYIVMRFDETDDVDVTMSCVAYVQPEDRVIVGDNMNLANDAITSAKIADDAGNEIAGQVWGEDATANQTQGTFGQAIGDPVADATTMWSVINSTGDKLPTNYIMGSAVATAKDDEIDAILLDTGTDGVVLANDAITSAKIEVGAIGNDEFNVTERYWPVYNVIDLTNESGNQNPTTTTFDTDFVATIDITLALEPLIYFPTTSEEPTQDAACNMMEIATKITGYNTTTKVITVDALPVAPDYRCKFWRY